MLEKEKLEKKLKEWFEWFHQNPELSYEEYATTDKIREILTQAGIKILPYELETGLVAVIEGEKEGPVQALRCDIDALPVKEQTNLAYASRQEGKMHACGHDFHITAGIGCALLLNEKKRDLKGTVKIIFQPGEETSLGALKILETDVMEDVEQIWGFHADPTNEVGTVGIREGYVAAAADRFVITVRGVGCHGAHPDDGIDPVPVAVGIVQGLSVIGFLTHFHYTLCQAKSVISLHQLCLKNGARFFTTNLCKIHHTVSYFSGKDSLSTGKNRPGDIGINSGQVTLKQWKGKCMCSDIV